METMPVHATDALMCTETTAVCSVRGREPLVARAIPALMAKNPLK